MLWIRDILVRIRIRIRTTDLRIRIFITSIVVFWRYIYIIFQRQKVIKRSQNTRNPGFSFYFCLMMEESWRSKKHTDPLGPDPQQWFHAKYFSANDWFIAELNDWWQNVDWLLSWMIDGTILTDCWDEWLMVKCWLLSWMIDGTMLIDCWVETVVNLLYLKPNERT